MNKKGFTLVELVVVIAIKRCIDGVIGIAIYVTTITQTHLSGKITGTVRR